ncbi:hypothetical protein A3Q56_02034, partial [Intoshia linei]
ANLTDFEATILTVIFTDKLIHFLIDEMAICTPTRLSLIINIFIFVLQFKNDQYSNRVIMYLSLLDENDTLNILLNLIAHTIYTFNKKNVEKIGCKKNIISSITNMIGSSILNLQNENIKICFNMTSILILFYELLYLNRNFIFRIHCEIPEDATFFHNDVPKRSSLLSIFIEYLSITMQYIRADENILIVNLCLEIISVMLSDNYLIEVLHNVNFVFDVNLYIKGVKSRNVSVVRKETVPIIFCLIDIICNFFVSNLSRLVPYELLIKCTQILQNCLIYMKKNDIRLIFEWNILWKSCFIMLAYFVKNENCFVSNEALILIENISNILTTFLQYGDHFLYHVDDYLTFYVNILKCPSLIEQLLQIFHKKSCLIKNSKNIYIYNSMDNLRIINQYFLPVIAAYKSSNKVSNVSDEIISDIVHENFENLHLRCLSLKTFENKYNDKLIEILINRIGTKVRHHLTDICQD